MHAKRAHALNKLGQDILFREISQKLLILALALLNDVVLIEQVFESELRTIQHGIDGGRVRVTHFPKHDGARVRGRREEWESVWRESTAGKGKVATNGDLQPCLKWRPPQQRRGLFSLLKALTEAAAAGIPEGGMQK